MNYQGGAVQFILFPEIILYSSVAKRRYSTSYIINEYILPIYLWKY